MLAESVKINKVFLKYIVKLGRVHIPVHVNDPVPEPDYVDDNIQKIIDKSVFLSLRYLLKIMDIPIQKLKAFQDLFIHGTLPHQEMPC
jgi:hypothetical protein